MIPQRRHRFSLITGSGVRLRLSALAGFAAGVVAIALMVSAPVSEAGARSPAQQQAQQRQQAAAQQRSAAQKPGAQPAPVVESPKPDVVPTASLFFTPDEILALQRALAGIVTDAPAPAGKPQPKQVEKPRKIQLAGVVYMSDTSWIVWLNGKRVTPDRLLPEIVDIKVDRKAVALKWYDRKTNKIIAITLRPHQIYDIETGILLPG